MPKKFHLPTVGLLCLLAFLPSTTAHAVKSQQQPAKTAYTEPTTGMEFMAIPGGTFTMGNSDDIYARPVRELTLKPFFLGRHEVTFEEYSKFCDATGRQLPSANGWGIERRPVINVSWHDAVAYTAWLSEKTNKNFRLPSEAEWEYAAKGGAKTLYPWGAVIGKNNANCKGCGSRWDGLMTAPVGSFAPNNYGLHDMIGNVYEWCLDARHDNYMSAPADGSPWMKDGEDNFHITRGGSWMQSIMEMPTYRRCWDNTESRVNELGFRVLME